MKVAIVNDVPLAIHTLRTLVLKLPGFRIVWTAADGDEAVRLCAQQRPDILLMDLLMPRMDGIEATRQIMSSHPCLILVVTASVHGNQSMVFQAMSAGARDVIQTPRLRRNNDADDDTEKFLIKIKRFASLVTPRQPEPPASATPRPSERAPCGSLVVIGASSGGPGALKILLGGLHQDTPATVVMVQHINQTFTRPLARWLCIETNLNVALAPAGCQPLAGQFLLSRGDTHLVLAPGQSLRYQDHPSDNPHKPSIDVFFESVARYWRGDVIGVLLTGMGRDGALGLKALREAGHHTIVQDASTSAIFGMPQAAIRIDAACQTLPIQDIAPAILRRLTPRFTGSP